jgi:hypothetical protein
MRCGFLISTILALFLGGYAIGKSQATDKPTISLGPVRLHLAMSKELVIGALSPYYDVDELGMVTTKKGPPHESVGQVVFKDGRLSQVWKDWTLKNQEEGYELANHVYGIVNGFKQEGNTVCTLDTSTHQGPKTRIINTVFFHCGAKAIRLDAAQGEVVGQTTMNRGAVLNEILSTAD